MFTQLAGVIVQACAMLVAFFSAGEKIARSADNLATWADETSGSFVDEARAKRTQQKQLLDAATQAQAVKLADETKKKAA